LLFYTFLQNPLRTLHEIARIGLARAQARWVN